MANPYFDIDYLSTMGSVPAAVLADFEANNPGRIAKMILAISRLMDSYLFKRYDTPFKDPVPEVVKFHGTQILSHQLRVTIGFDPGSQQDAEIIQARKDAIAWLEMAANSKDGVVELPKREPEADKQDEGGVTRRKARAFSFASAIDWHRARKER